MKACSFVKVSYILCSRTPCAQKHYLFQFLQPFLTCLHTNRKTIELTPGFLGVVISKPEVFGGRFHLELFSGTVWRIEAPDTVRTCPQIKRCLKTLSVHRGRFKTASFSFCDERFFANMVSALTERLRLRWNEIMALLVRRSKSIGNISHIRGLSPWMKAALCLHSALKMMFPHKNI